MTTMRRRPCEAAHGATAAACRARAAATQDSRAGQPGMLAFLRLLAVMSLHCILSNKTDVSLHAASAVSCFPTHCGVAMPCSTARGRIGPLCGVHAGVKCRGSDGHGSPKCLQAGSHRAGAGCCDSHIPRRPASGQVLFSRSGAAPGCHHVCWRALPQGKDVWGWHAPGRSIGGVRHHRDELPRQHLRKSWSIRSWVDRAAAGWGRAELGAAELLAARRLAAADAVA
jgi:hypothetical protein